MDTIYCEGCGRPMDLVSEGQHFTDGVGSKEKAREIYAVYECEECNHRYTWNRGQGIVRKHTPCMNWIKGEC